MDPMHFGILSGVLHGDDGCHAKSLLSPLGFVSRRPDLHNGDCHMNYRIMEMWFLIMSLGKMFAMRASTSIGFRNVLFISERENRANAASMVLYVTCI